MKVQEQVMYTVHVLYVDKHTNFTVFLGLALYNYIHTRI